MGKKQKKEKKKKTEGEGEENRNERIEFLNQNPSCQIILEVNKMPFSSKKLTTLRSTHPQA